MQAPQQDGASRSNQARQAASGAARPAESRAAHTAPSAAQGPAPPAAEPAPPPPAARARSDGRAADEPQAERQGAAQAAKVAGSASEEPPLVRRGSRHADTAPSNGAQPRADEADRHAQAAPAEAAVLGEPEGGGGAQPPGLQQVVAKVEAQALAGLASEPAPAPAPQDGAARPGGWQRYEPAVPPQEAGYGRWQHQSGANSSGHEVAAQDSGAGYGGWSREHAASDTGRGEPAAAPPDAGPGYGGWRQEGGTSSSARSGAPAAAQDGGSGYGSWSRERSARNPERSEPAPLPPQHAAAARSAWPPKDMPNEPAGLPEEAAGRGAWARDADAAAAPDQAAGAPGRPPIPLAVQGVDRGWRDAHSAAASRVGMRVDAPSWSDGGPPQRPPGSADGARVAPGGLPGAQDEGPRSMHAAPQAPPLLGLQGRAAPAQSMYWGGEPQLGATPAAAGAPWSEGSGAQPRWGAQPATSQQEEAGARGNMSAQAPGGWAPQSAGRPQPPVFPPHPPHLAGVREAPPQLPLPAATQAPGAAGGPGVAAWAPAPPGGAAALLASDFGAADAKRVWAGEGPSAAGGVAPTPHDAPVRLPSSEAERKAPSPAGPPAPHAWSATPPPPLPLDAAPAAPAPTRATPPVQPQPAAAADRVPPPAPVWGGTPSPQAGGGSRPSSSAATGAPPRAPSAATPEASSAGGSRDGGGGNGDGRRGRPLTERELQRQQAEQARSAPALSMQNRCLACQERGHSCAPRLAPRLAPRCPLQCLRCTLADTFC